MSHTINWKSLKEKYFFECTENTPDGLRISLLPNDLFSWFQKELSAEPGTTNVFKFREERDVQDEFHAPVFQYQGLFYADSL